MPLELLPLVPTGWRKAMRPYVDPEVLARLGEFLCTEYAERTVYPPARDLFAALRFCPPERARVLILGQDPYHGAGQAHGLSFSVPAGVAVPPSLRNIFRELVE